MKISIIAIAKHENLYINEWINYHLALGFDKIIIADNNDSNSEKISDVVDNPNVIIEDYHDVVGVQPIAYTELFLKYREQFDWIAFIDIDEFIFLEEKYNNNIKNFLSISPFNEANIIKLCWKIYTTNTELDVKDNNYNVLDRFKDIHISGEENFAKSIIKTSIEWRDGYICGHGYYRIYKNVLTSDGNECKCNFVSINHSKDEPIYDNAWINHYPTKTIGEYIRQKYFRGGPNHNNRRYSNIRYFYKYNDEKPEITEYAKKLIEEHENTDNGK